LEIIELLIIKMVEMFDKNQHIIRIPEMFAGVA